MRRTYNEEVQIIGILKEAELGVPVTELCRTHGMSDATFYKWGGLPYIFKDHIIIF